MSMIKPKNGHKKFKMRLAKLLRMAEDTKRFEDLWECLKRDGYISDWERGAASDEDVVDYSRTTLSHFDVNEGRSYSAGQRVRQRQARRTLRTIPVEPSEREMNIADALRKHLAVHAARRPLVQRFRRENLPQGRLLRKDEEIAEFLAKELEIETEDVEQYLDSRKGESGDLIPFDLSNYQELTDEEVAQNPGLLTDEDLAQILAEEERVQEKRMEEDWDGPAGWQLTTLGEWLVGKYPWKSVGDAEVFLVSGRPPQLAEPLCAAVDMGNATYSITFSPWVSEETILRVYHFIQNSHRRPPGDKTLRLFHFVLDQADEEGRLPSWSKLLVWWNAANPSEAFSDRSALRKAYARAVESLVPPYLPLT